MCPPQSASVAVAAAVATKPQVPVVSHETILEIEAKARETYKISVNLCKITSVLNLKDFGKPIEVVTRINEFALRSSDIAVCGESCVSEDDSVHMIFKLNNQQRLDNVFFRAVALMEAETVEGVDQRVLAANAVRRAWIETRAEYEVRKAARVAEKEKRDMKTHIKAESLKK